MTHAELVAAIQLELSRGDTRLIRIIAGWAWQGQVAKGATRERLVLLHPRKIHLAPDGTSDLIGWGPGAKFAGIEVKVGRDRLRDEQRAFLATVAAAGGLAGEARSVDDAAKILSGAALI
ncbi:MAG: VRR-NUC domain-containing protein [Terriglobales bacterium]